MKNSNKKSVVIFAVVFAFILLLGSFAGVLTGVLIVKNKTGGNAETDIVSDAFCEIIKDNNITRCYHIPQINSDAEGITEVNKNIYNTLYQVYSEGVTVSQRDNGFLILGSMTYTYVQKDSTVSIVVQTQDARSLEYSYYVFNADTESGKEMTKENMCTLFSTDVNSFNTKVRNAVKEYSDREKTAYPENEVTKYIEPIIKRTVSAEYIDAAMPYINKDGELFAVVSLFSSGGKDTYPHMLNLETSLDEGTLPVCTKHDDITYDSAPATAPAPEVTYVYVEQPNKNNEDEEDTTKAEAEEVTTKKDNKNTSSGELTKEILTSHSWHSVRQFEYEYIFFEDGTFESYGAGYETGTYEIKNNILYVDGLTFEYTSVEENADLQNDEYLNLTLIETLNPGEKFFYSTEFKVWLIDATDRFEADKDYCIYRNFAIDNYETKWSKNYKDYIYAEFTMFDIDEDGTEELIVHEGTSEQSRKYHFYTIKGKEIISLGSLGAWHATLCDNDGYLIKYDGMGGEGNYYTVAIENGQITETNEGTFTFPPVPDFGEALKFSPTMY